MDLQNSASNRLYIPGLDGIRAIAVSLVFVAHLEIFEALSGAGSLGVTIFFFLSGYLITTLIRREIARNGRLDLKKFYTRRALRIFPVMYLALIVFSAATLLGVINGTFYIESFLAQALHVTNYWILFGPHGEVPGLATMWSLAVEEHFYLVFPIIVSFLLIKFNRKAASAFVLCLVLLAPAYRWYLVDNAVYNLQSIAPKTWWFLRIFSSTDTRVDSILFGCLLALAINPVFKDRGYKILTSPAVVVASGLAVLAAQFFLSQAMILTFRWSIQGLAFMSLFALAMRADELFIMKWIESAPFRWMGRISYSFYLFHMLPILILKERFGLGGLKLLAGASLSALVISTLIYFAVEKPLERVRHKQQAAPQT